MNSVDALRDVVAGAIVDRAIEVSRQLADLGVPHVLIGGLAVGIHGHPRATKDVDFMGSRRSRGPDPSSSTGTS